MYRLGLGSQIFDEVKDLLSQRHLEVGIYLARIVERLSDLLEGIDRFPAVLDRV